MTCTVTGALVDPTGAILANAPVRFVPRVEVGSTGDATMVGRDVTVTSDVAGQISVSLEPGLYRGYVQGTRKVFEFSVGVPDAATAQLEDLIDQIPPLTPGLVEQARDARDAARDWAEGTLPGGPGTKSSREWSEVAEAAAETAVADAIAEAAPILAEMVTRAETAADEAQAAALVALGAVSRAMVDHQDVRAAEGQEINAVAEHGAADEFVRIGQGQTIGRQRGRPRRMIDPQDRRRAKRGGIDHVVDGRHPRPHGRPVEGAGAQAKVGSRQRHRAVRAGLDGQNTGRGERAEIDRAVCRDRATLTPETVGDEYPTEGRVCIGREIATFSRSGDVLTLTARGVDGSTAEAHSAADVVQVCQRYEGIRIADAAYDLLVNRASVPASYIDLPAWQAENDDWMAGIVVTATIAKPTGVATLIGELQQLGCIIWWDEVAKQIRFEVNSPLRPGETAQPITDRAHLITGTPEADRGDDQRISELQLWHGVINPAEATDSSRNYSKSVIAPATNDLYGQDQIKTIFCRWFGQFGDDAAASVIAERLKERYRNTPRILSGVLDGKDRALALGQIVRAETRAIQDAFGSIEPVTMQVNYVARGDSRVEFRAEEYDIDGRFGYIMQDPQPDYDTATDAEKAEGCFIMDDAIGVFPDGTGPYVIF